MANINFRVFRRNSKNLILLWNSAHLSKGQGKAVSAYLVDQDGMGDGRELEFSSFVPDNPEKFATDVGGIVISHAKNGMDPAAACAVKVVFGDGDDSMEVVKEVLPANSMAESGKPAQEHGKVVRMYAMDYSTNTWVPWPHDGIIPVNVQMLIRDNS